MSEIRMLDLNLRGAKKIWGISKTGICRALQPIWEIC